MLILVLIIIGCSQKVVCNKPYILVGSECCLDEDGNSICDKDESKGEQSTTPVNKDSKAEVNDESTESKFSLNDLQADINKVISYRTVLTKDTEDSTAEFYLHSDLRSRLLGKFPSGGEPSKATEPYNKVLTKRFVLVSRIKDKKDYLKDDNDFYNYIVKNKDYILAPIQEGRDTFQEEFNIGEIPSWMYDLEDPSLHTRQYKYRGYSYIDFEITSEDLYFNHIKKMETVGNKVIETAYVSVDNYKVIYQPIGTYEEINDTVNRTLSGINYLHTVNVFCSPSLVITLYPEKDYIKKEYDAQGISESTFLNDIRFDRKSMLIDATALVSMCEQRYEFTYIRGR